MRETALVTGASCGIGETFARELAALDRDLILVARSQDKLELLATELASQYQIQTTVIPQDLTAPNAGQILYDDIKTRGLTVDLLINNAGFGDYGKFSDRTLAKQLAMIQLNVTVLTQLTGLFLPEMQQRGKGGIINISSIAGFQPLPYMSVYAATKAFVLNFTEALWAENKDSGVSILALCPGPTESEFFNRANFPASFAEQGKNSLVSATEVVREALKTLEKNQSTVVTGGIGNQFIVNLPRFLPRDLLVSAVEKQFKK
jgi:uncharacterized protein